MTLLIHCLGLLLEGIIIDPSCLRFCFLETCCVQFLCLVYSSVGIGDHTSFWFVTLMNVQPTMTATKLLVQSKAVRIRSQLHHMIKNCHLCDFWLEEISKPVGASSVLRYISPVLAFGTERRYLTKEFCYCLQIEPNHLLLNKICRTYEKRSRSTIIVEVKKNIR